jgi:hypothetical protein
MGQKIDLIFLLDQTLLHCLATPAEHRLGAPRTSAADLRGDLRLKRSSVRASQPTAELLDDVFALLQKFSPHQTPPCRGAILGVRHSLAKVDSGTNSGRLQRPRAMPFTGTPSANRTSSESKITPVLPVEGEQTQGGIASEP